MVFRSQLKFSILCQHNCGMRKKYSRERGAYTLPDFSAQQGSCFPAVRTWVVIMRLTSCWEPNSLPIALRYATVCFYYPAGRALSCFKSRSWEEFPWLCLSEHPRALLFRLQERSISRWLVSCAKTTLTSITVRPASSDAPKSLGSKNEAADQG